MEHERKILTDRIYLSLETTNCLKGIFAIIVVIHHLYQRTDIINNRVLGFLFQTSGFLSVAIFFFLSGYGIAASIQRKGNSYITSFTKKRVLPLYINNVIMVLAYIFLYTVILGEEIPTKKLVTSFLWGGTVISGGWYLQAILVFYIACYFIFRFARGTKLQFCLFNAFLVLYCAVCFLIKLPSNWYVTAFAMPFGMYWLYQKEYIVEILKRHYILSLAFCCFAFAISFVGYALCPNDYVSILLGMLTFTIFPAVVTVLIYIIPVNFGITRILGKYFFEIYVVQGIAMDLLHSSMIYVTNDWLYCILCLISIAVMAVAVHPLFTAINKKIKEV